MISQDDAFKSAMQITIRKLLSA